MFNFQCAGLLSALLPLAASGQNSVQWTTNYYPVTGATLMEIRHSMESTRPAHVQGRVDGQTDWRIEWQFSTMPTPDGCRCRAFSTRTLITMTLPRWRAPTNAEPSTLQAWTNYSAALGRHEAGHAQIALAGANEMAQRARETGPVPDCEALKSKLDALAQGVLADYRRRDAQYDEKTQHGATQGAVWPGGRPRARPPSR